VVFCVGNVSYWGCALAYEWVLGKFDALGGGAMISGVAVPAAGRLYCDYTLVRLYCDYVTSVYNYFAMGPVAASWMWWCSTRAVAVMVCTVGWRAGAFGLNRVESDLGFRSGFRV